MTEALRVGIVGAGSWSRAAHIPGFQHSDDLDVVALCDIDRGLAAQVAREVGIPGVYGSASEMLDRERLDLVSIVTPDDRHAADVMAALAAGAAILCEKPLATSLAGARALALAAESAARQTRVGFILRYAPAVIRLREIVLGGDIGQPHLLQAFQQNGQFLDPATPMHWKMERLRTGGGAVVEYGIHTLDLARWVMGEVSRVCASGRTLIPSRPLPGGAGTAEVNVDDSTLWLMDFASGAMGIGHAGWATVGRPPGLELRVFGSRGAVRCLLADDLPEAAALWLAGADGIFRPVDTPVAGTPLMPISGPWWFRFAAHLIGHFVAEIRAGHSSGPAFRDGAQAQAILDALLHSMSEDRWVTVPTDAMSLVAPEPPSVTDPSQAGPLPVTQS